MNTATLTNLSLAPSATNRYAQTRQDLNALQQALSGNNLPAAQGAFAQLQTLLQASSSTTSTSALTSTSAVGGTTQATSPVQADVTALGNALSSNNLSAAQTAFNQLQTDLKTSGSARFGLGGFHHHHAHGAAANSTAVSGGGSTTTGLAADAWTSAAAGNGATSGSLLNLTA